MVHFEYLKEEEFPEYWRYSIESGMHDMQKAGFFGRDMTYEEAEKQLRKYLPDGLKTTGHHIMHILNNDGVVGNIWFEIRSKSVREAYLWDIIIFKEHRGKGYGRQSMNELESFVKKEGVKQISLNVFPYNTVARNLYQTSGYKEAAITMLKDL
ncbi:MAG: GNAT family N-acetyltransferase [Cuniculiplasma divulgatum]|jgi:ribosomal protein S18 acetylase RimI-like enzyme|nr:MAG: GNAT family N-acetyltransferase [Cuniculiplasma divulgatum]